MSSVDVPKISLLLLEKIASRLHDLSAKLLNDFLGQVSKIEEVYIQKFLNEIQGSISKRSLNYLTSNLDVYVNSFSRSLDVAFEKVKSNFSAKLADSLREILDKTEDLSDIDNIYVNSLTPLSNSKVQEYEKVVSNLVAEKIDEFYELSLADGSAPVVDPVVSPVVAPVVDPVVSPVVSPVVAPVVDPVISPVVDPVVAPVVAPVVDPVVSPVVSPVVAPVVEEVPLSSGPPPLPDISEILNSIL